MSDLLIPICATRYPEYQFISDNTISRSAAQDKRNSIDSLYGIIFDVTLLSESDYLVCTFSSQVSYSYTIHSSII